MHVNAICCAGAEMVAVAQTPERLPATAATASSAAKGPPVQKEDGPVSVARCRALGTAQSNHETLTVVSAASVGLPCHMAAPVFPTTKAEATAVASLALVGWVPNRAELASAFVATRWDSTPVIPADLVAVAAFTGLTEAES